MEVVLFACVHNAGRSQMAAAWFNAMADATKVHLGGHTTRRERPSRGPNYDERGEHRTLEGDASFLVRRARENGDAPRHDGLRGRVPVRARRAPRRLAAGRSEGPVRRARARAQRRHPPARRGAAGRRGLARNDLPNVVPGRVVISDREKLGTATSTHRPRSFALCRNGRKARSGAARSATERCRAC